MAKLIKRSDKNGHRSLLSGNRHILGSKTFLMTITWDVLKSHRHLARVLKKTNSFCQEKLKIIVDKFPSRPHSAKHLSSSLTPTGTQAHAQCWAE